MKDWNMFLFKQVIFRFVLIFQRVFVDLLDWCLAPSSCLRWPPSPSNWHVKRPLQPFIEELNKIAFASQKVWQKSMLWWKEMMDLIYLASLKQWWLCIVCQLWRHLCIASTAFQRKWNSQPAQWCRPWLPHDSWLPLLRFNDSNGKAFGWWYFRHLHGFMTWLAWQHNCRSCNKTAKRVTVIIPTWWG